MNITPLRSLSALAAGLIFSLPHGRAAEADGAKKLTNAAQNKYGALISLSAPPEVKIDSRTNPEMVFDNNVHSRQVVTGAPYTFTIELAQPMLIEKLAFAQSDYATELAPKDLEITLDGEPPVKHSLEAAKSEGRKPVWQEFPVGKTVKTVVITVLSNHSLSEKAAWGGLGEIAVLTPENLDETFKLPDYNAKSPAFVDAPPPIDPASVATSVKLPKLVPPGEHPRLLVSGEEVKELRVALEKSPRGPETLTKFKEVADKALTDTPDFPDPKGPPAMKRRGDALSKIHDRISMNCATLGMAYQLTGDRKYADKAAQILIGYAQRYELYPEHKGVNAADTGKITSQRLSEAMWLIPLILGYDYIASSGALTDADKKLIDDELLRRAVVFIRRKDPKNEVAERSAKNPDWKTAMAPVGKGGIGNWELYYNTATLTAGVMLGDSDYVDVAVDDLRKALRQGIGSDGMWGEGAIGYQLFAINALIPAMETAAHQGIDLYGFDHCRFKMLFDSPLRYAYPDGSSPGINDSSRGRFGNWSSMSYDYASLRYGDPAYAYIVNASPRQLHQSTSIFFPTRIYDTLAEPPAVEYPSTLFENLGYAILRNKMLYALMDYGPNGGPHGHPDKLNLILFAIGAEGKGDEMGGEPKFYPYQEPLHGDWTKQTVAHNTLTVNERSQTAAAGRLRLFEDSPKLKAMRAETVEAYPGVFMDRTVVITPLGVVDFYQARSSAVKTWDRTLAYSGTLAELAGLKPGDPLAASPGYRQIRVAKRGNLDEPWIGTWETAVGKFRAAVAAAPGQEVILGFAPDDSHLAVVRQKGKQAGFAMAYQLDSLGQPVKSVELLPPAAVRVSRVKYAEGAETLVFVGDGNSWEAEGWKSDALVLVVHKNGETTDVLLGGGTKAEGEGGTIELEAPGNGVAERTGKTGPFTLTKSWKPEIATGPVASGK